MTKPRTLNEVCAPLMLARDGDNGEAVVPHLTAAELHVLARQLSDICDGVDAREVFGQPKGPGRKRDRQDERAAFAYWWHRAHNPADAKGALDAAHVESGKDRETLRRIVRRYRDYTLRHLELAVDTTAIRAELAKRRPKRTLRAD